MAEFVWTSRSPIEAQTASARLGRTDGADGIALREVQDFDLALVACRRGKWSTLKTRGKKHFGVEPPAKPKAVRAGDALLVWSGADQFLVFAPRGTTPLAAQLAAALGDAASVSDQSDARCLLSVSGPRVRDMLVKLTSLDLDDAVFPAGSAASTLVDHANVGFWRCPQDPSAYRILCLTSYAGSLWHAVVEAGAEFGVDAGSTSFSA